MNPNYRVTLAHAVGSENGTTDGKRGDQTGKEVRLQSWYLSGDGWDYVLRAKNEVNRNLIATDAEYGARNPHLGYSQPDRYSAWDIVCKKCFDLSLLDKDANCDCSQLVSIASNYAGYAIPKDTYTGNMKSRYTATKGFKIYSSAAYTKKYDKLVRGDILLREGHHTATVINTIYWLQSILKRSNAKGRTADVKALQARLNELLNSGLVVDGEFGHKTEAAVKDFQNKNKLTVDGIVGHDTAITLGMVYA